MLRADARIVQAGRDGVRRQRLALVVLQQIGAHAVQHARRPRGERGRVAAGLRALATGFAADELDRRVGDEGVEDADGVRAAADAGDHGVGQPPRQGQHLLPGLHADDPLKVPHHHGERMRAADRADAVVGVLDRGDPVPERLVHRVLERAAARGDRDDLGAEHPHPGHVQRLPPGVLLPHVDHAVQAEQGAGGRGGHSVLPGTGLGDDPGLAHPPGQQGLAEHVVDLVRAGVRQVLALQQDAAAGLGAEPGNLGHQRGPAGVVAQQPGQLSLELRVRLRRGVLLDQLVQGRGQRLGGEAAAVAAEVAGGVGHGRARLSRAGRRSGGSSGSGCSGGGHQRSPRSAGWEAAVTRSATAVRGSLPVTRLSPTSTASAPAAA